MNFITFSFRKHPILIALVAFIFALAIWLILTFISGAHDVRHNKGEQGLEPWMSPQFIERRWDISKPELFDILGLDLAADPKTLPKTIGLYAKERGLPLEEIDARLDAKRGQGRDR